MHGGAGYKCSGVRQANLPTWSLTAYVFYWEQGRDEQIVWIFRSVNQIAIHMGDRYVQRRLGPDDLPISILVPANSNSAR